MPTRLRAHDWAATSLGPIEAWPARLRAVVDLMLASPLLSSVAVGPERLLLYNDAAARFYGDRHPAALGRSLAETFPESFPAVADFYDRVFAGEAVTVTAQPLDVRQDDAGEVFDAYLTPVTDDECVVFAAHMTGIEVSARLRADKVLQESETRQAFLLGLSDALRPLNDAEDIRLTASTVLGRHLGASRVAYAEDAGDGESFLVYPNYVDGVPDMAGRFRYADYGSAIRPTLWAGRNLVQPDLAGDTLLSDAERQAFAQAEIGASMNVPLVKQGRLVAFLGINYATAHDFQPIEIALAEEAAERTWAAVERARAEAALRASEDKYRTLFATMSQGYALIELLPDPSGDAADYRILEVNPAFEHFHGRTVAQAKGRTAREVFPELQDRWAGKFAEIVKAGRPVRFENQIAGGGAVDGSCLLSGGR